MDIIELLWDLEVNEFMIYIKCIKKNVLISETEDPILEL